MVIVYLFQSGFKVLIQNFRKNMDKKNALIPIILFFALPLILFSQQKIVLIEEFTNYNCVSCAAQTKVLDSVFNENAFNTILLKYHTNFPNEDPFYLASPTGINLVKKFYGIDNNIPTIIVDGHIKPTGSLPAGSSGNISKKLLDSLSLIDPILRFFAVGHVYLNGYNNMDVAGGASSLGGDHEVFYTKALVEQVVNLDKPTSVTGEVAYNYVFRSFVFFRKPISLPQSGSHHSVDLIYSNKNNYNLDNLGVVHYISDANGKILNAYYDPPYNINEYSILTRNTSNSIAKYWEDTISPSIKIINNGAYDVSDFKIVTDINGHLIRDTFKYFIQAGDSIVFIGKTIKLPPGKNLVQIDVEDYNEIAKGGILSKKPEAKKYLILGNHPLPDETFENSNHADSIGLFFGYD